MARTLMELMLTCVVVNSTISIVLTEPWDPSSVTMKTTRKPLAYTFNGQAIWKDPSSNAFYIWGGWKTSNPPDKKIARFTADPTGGGSWTESKSVGCYFGGFTSEETGSNFVGNGNQSVQGRPAPGIVSFDMRSREMRNISSSRFGKYGTFKGGSSQFVPFGPQSLLVVRGGWEASVSATRFKD
ncbi:hypothetical protein COL922a_001061 [Colletotrichum nupharicola]|nr:hypothetical protein COL922a_001061 [Colletotrichum nupharicola]